MSYADSAWLLAETKALLKRPASDEDTSDAALYLFLGAAQRYWVSQLAIHFPNVMMEAPELMTTSDGGYTYTTLYEPIGALQVYDRNGGTLLNSGAEWDTSADYVPQGQTIRITGRRQRTTAPYARYIKQPGALDGSTAPVLKPTQLRDLLPPRAAALFATAGGFRDPSPYLATEARLWGGDPSIPGDVGYMGMLKKGANMYSKGGSRRWWQSADLYR